MSRFYVDDKGSLRHPRSFVLVRIHDDEDKDPQHHETKIVSGSSYTHVSKEAYRIMAVEFGNEYPVTHWSKTGIAFFDGDEAFVASLKINFPDSLVSVYTGKAI